MKFNGIVVLIYGLLVTIGGIIGFIKARSIPSLAMGLLFGAGLIFSGLAAYRKRNIGFYSAAALTLILAIFFTYRYILTQSLLPAGLMSAISLVVIIALYLGGKDKLEH